VNPSRGWFALLLGAMLLVLAPRALEAQALVRVIGQVQWIAGARMQVMTDGAHRSTSTSCRRTSLSYQGCAMATGSSSMASSPPMGGASSRRRSGATAAEDTVPIPVKHLSLFRAFLAQAVKANPKLKAGVAAYEKGRRSPATNLVNISQGAW